ncbi:MAG: penicillin-binding protein 1C [Anaerolineales bacterium]|nr:MAG: penicillin-binding protein 1C [Anaerolineales bacterium]
MNQSPTDPGWPVPGKTGSDQPESDSDDTRPQRPQAPPRYRPDDPTHIGYPGRPAAHQAPASGGYPDHPTRVGPPPVYQPPGRSRPSVWIWLVRGLILALFGVGFFSLLGIAASVIGYFAIAAELPPPEELQTQAFTFASSAIYDRNGNLLWELIDPSAGRRTWVPLSRVSPYLQQATIATEDRFFYANVGVDPIAVARAIYYNVSEGEIVSGGSTITQQLARNVLLTPEERNEQTVSRKIREAVLAMELFRRYPKDKILEIYLNQIYYGNLAYGIEAASQTYFGKAATDLTLAQAALLAGLPQSPAVYDPIANPEVAKTRQQVVLNLMAEAGYITPAQAVAAYQEELQYAPPRAEFAAPHFVTYIRQLLEARYGPDLLYQEPGVRVQTSLDPRIQAIAEEAVTNQVNALQSKDVTNGAVVVLSVKTGEILAMVGSKDFNDETIDVQVNVALRPRQPGSSIKPLTYLAAFEKGWTPSTLIMDVPVKYPDWSGGVYEPVNYDGKFHGPVLLRGALANSYNIPAVKTLEFIGLPALKEMAGRLGITTLTRDDYGLALTLGGGEVTLLEMSGAYQAMANDGLRVSPVAILRVTDSLGRVISEYRPPEGTRVLRSEHAYLMTHILADNQARTSAFGPNSVLNLSRPAAVKTGTTNDFRDNWAVGYTPDIVVGVWVGNADNTPMQGVSGVSGAGPIWQGVMERALEGVPVRDFIRPPTIIEMEICADSGSMPSPVCPQRTTEIFAQDQPPLGPEHDIHRMVRIDTSTNSVATEFCPPNLVIERYFQVYPPDGRAWAIERGIEQPPDQACPVHTGSARALITWPAEGQTVQGVVTVEGVALAANFSHYVVEYGVSWGPQAFGPVTGPVNRLVEGGPLADWDTRQEPNGPYTLRVVVFDQGGGSYEGRVTVLVDNPLPTPTDTPTPRPATDTPTPQPATDTPTLELATDTPTLEPATDTPTLEAPTDTPMPETPTATSTPVPASSTPTSTSSPTGTSTPAPGPPSKPTVTGTPSSG